MFDSRFCRPRVLWGLAPIALVGLLTPAVASGAVKLLEQPPTFVTSEEDHEVVPVIVVAEGARFREAPSKAAATIGRGKFLDVFYLLDTASEGTTQYALAATRDAWGSPEKIIGWFDAKDVLIRRQAIKERSGIFLKGLVVNQWRKADESSGGLEIAGARLLAGPGQKFAEKGKIGLFSFYFIFAESTKRGSNKTFYLLGEGPIIESLEAPQESLVGWVEAERI
ncbi:MAG: hypothetical protein AAFY88_18510, partial [Acidobacteriota bacterium]